MSDVGLRAMSAEGDWQERQVVRGTCMLVIARSWDHFE